MKYYLDTSAVYHINKIPKGVLQNSFYSVFALIEILAGLNGKEYNKRKAILGSAINSNVKCDYNFPEKLIFEAFDYYKNYEFREERKEDLFDIIGDVIACQSFEEFDNISLLKKRKFDFEYFIQRDKFYTENFYNATIKGNSTITTELKNKTGKSTVIAEGKEYDLNSRRAIVNFLNGSSINSSITILALANSAINISQENTIEMEVYSSYNGRLNLFVDGMSEYSKIQIINDGIPNRNDFQDLIHMIYLGNNNDLTIISNDLLFARCLPGKTITTHNFGN